MIKLIALIDNWFAKTNENVAFQVILKFWTRPNKMKVRPGKDSWKPFRPNWNTRMRGTSDKKWHDESLRSELRYGEYITMRL